MACFGFRSIIRRFALALLLVLTARVSAFAQLDPQIQFGQTEAAQSDPELHAVALRSQLFGAAGHNNLKLINRVLDLEPCIINTTQWKWKVGKVPKNVSLELPVHRALYWGKKEAADLLIKRGAKVDIFVAAFMGWDDKVRKFVKDDPKVLQLQLYGGGDPFGTPLRAALWSGEKSTFKLLMELGADPKQQRPGKLFEGVIRHDWVDVAQLLLEHGISSEARPNWHSSTPLAMARSVEMAELLLKYKANIGPNKDLHETPLLCAVKSGNRRLVECLVEHGADVNYEGANYYSALDHALAAGRNDITEFLLKKGAKWTFTSAVIAGRIDLVEGFLKENPKRITEKFGIPKSLTQQTPLEWAVIMGNLELFQFLFKQAIYARDRSLLLAGNNPTILQLLLATKTDPDIVAPNLREAFMGTCRAGSAEIIQIYIKHGVFDGRKGVPQVQWDDAFVAAAQSGKLANVKALYEIKPDRDIKETLAKALYESVGTIDVLKFLLAEKAPINYRWGVNPNIIGADDSRFAIHTAAKLGSIEATKLLLEAGATINDKDGEERTLTDYAVMEDRVALVEWLGKNTKIRGNIRLKDGKTFPQSVEMLEVLLKYGWKPNGERKDVHSPLHEAVRRDDEIMVRMLLKAGAAVNAVDGNSSTPLHLAPHKYRLTDVLLKNKASVNAIDERGDTPLHLAAQSGNPAVVRLLLANGADPYAKNRRDQTPLQAAIARGSSSLEMAEIIQILKTLRTK